MRSSLFPFEILSKIASFLPKSDQAACSHVCKVWKIPFQEAMWNTLEIMSDTKLAEICSATNDGKIYHTNGHLVRTLIFGKWLKTSDLQLLTVQKRFQKISRLYIREKGITTSLGQSSDWGLWKALTHLDICISSLYLENESRDLLKVLACLPNIRRLECRQRHGYTWQYTLEEFEALHACIPQAEYLSLTLDLAPFTDQNKRIVAETRPTRCLKVLKLRMDKADLRWLYYFAIKYPALHTVEWNADIQAETTNEYRQETLSMLSTLSSPFSQLENVLMDGTPGREWWYITFLELLGNFNTTVKHIGYLMRYGQTKPDLEKRIIQNCAQVRPTKLSLKFMSSDLEFADPSTIPVTIGVCQSITDLRIDALTLSVAVDILLDKCPSLKRLKLAANSLSIAKGVTGFHGVRLIEFVGSRICVGVLGHLSFHCRSLNYLRLTKMEIIGPMHENGHVSLDMLYSHLEYLQLTCVSFLASDGNEFKVSTVINFVALDQLNMVPQHDNSLSPILPTKDPNPIFSSLLPWIHMYCVWDGTYELIKSRSLAAEEAVHVQEYYQSFQKRKRAAIHSTERRRSYLGQLDQEYWRDDLDRGFVLFRCGSVKNYCIATLGHHDDVFWDRLQGQFM
ncbi:hypothetical protein CLU79DRAFT_855361 [Phycomyces nitens]|nr:hypothetical protein CLU79DRAFT_855361 [Phycomyces nitens]